MLESNRVGKQPRYSSRFVRDKGVGYRIDQVWVITTYVTLEWRV